MKATNADQARVARARRQEILKRKREGSLRTNHNNSMQGTKRGSASVMEEATSQMSESAQNQGTKKSRRKRPRTNDNCLQRCPECEALVWKSESTKKDTVTGKLSFTICCQQGRIELPRMRDPPTILQSLLKESAEFRRNIRAYNSILAFTSMGAKLDNTVSSKNGPYTFRIHGQNHHSIGSLLPVEGQTPRFVQLYIYDTANEVQNRMNTLNRKEGSEPLNINIVAKLIQMMDENNELAKVFRKARDWYESRQSTNFSIRLIGQKDKGRQYDLPSSDEVVGLIVGDLATTVEGRDIIVQRRSDQFQRISDISPLYMPMQYPLLFPYGEKGFEKNIPYKDQGTKKIKREYVTIREYYAYQIQTRLSQGNHILKSGRLFHQYLVDAYSAIEQGHLRWIKNNKKTLRAEVYNNVRDAVTKGDTDARLVGRTFILPSSYTGSPRYMAENFHDAMAICRWKGNPQLFITITANPNWEEITEHIQQAGNNTANDRPDIECRVFKMKLQEMLSDIQDGVLGGETEAVVYTIEFQKRGLPHAHILIWLEEKFKNPSPAQIDSLVSAEIPDKNIDPEGYTLVEQFMMHGPCGLDRPQSPCMKNGACTKKFPKSYKESTTVNKDGYVKYKRRKDERLFVTKGKTKMDNAFVVPHNITLLKKYKAHINVEWCNRTRAIKYLFKYITKGVDRATMIIQKNDDNSNKEQGKRKEGEDEIKNYLECRYLSACEAAWRIFAYDIHYRTPAVRRLTIHLPNQQRVVYNDSDDLEYVISQEGITKTMFTEWMTRNKMDDEARKLTYAQFPIKYVWDGTNKVWTKRAQGQTVGRFINIHPAAGELYYLKRLVDIIRGPRSYTEILTVGTRVHQTFKSACYTRGLLDGDLEWHDAMDEAGKWATPTQLRHLFATLLLYCEVGSPYNLWKHFWKEMSDDIPRRLRKTFRFKELQFTNEELQNYTLIEIEKILLQNEKSLMDFVDMPKPDPNLLTEMTNTLLREETNYNIVEQQKEHDILSQSLNEEQKIVFDEVIDSVNQRKGKLIFLYGAGGTGKTYLYRTIITKLRAERKIVLPVASSGIAALLLPGGRTAHSRFKIPINVHDESLCEVKAGTMLTELLIETDLII